MKTLVDLLIRATHASPDHIAVECPPAGAMSYGELDALSDRVRDRLRQFGVGPSDRVGIYLRKSIDAYAAMLGAMKAGAAYVPVDYTAPAWRTAYILADCQVRVAFVEDELVEKWRSEIEKTGPVPIVVALTSPAGGSALKQALARLDAEHGPAPVAAAARIGPNDLAYILYTSGSTGMPKGVMLSHENATSYVDWCCDTLSPTATDRFSSHAPFHFDLSILDLYVPLKVGATVVLIDAEQGKEPSGLAQLIADRRLSVWYSTPTILTILATYGKMERNRYDDLRLVLFAGEVFPAKHLRTVKELLPRAVFYNLYGPTETNVCTYYRIPDEVEPDRTQAYPIGRVCAQFRARVVDESGDDVRRGAEGELLIHGPGVMQGYWNLPERTAEAFLTDGHGDRWYRTGDLVTEGVEGIFTYVGRRDRMVKRRGYRIELGEIEERLYRHPDIKEAAVVALRDGEGSVRIKAFLTATNPLSVIELKKFCARELPTYMAPDAFAFLTTLPRTSTDKVDYQRLTQTG